MPATASFDRVPSDAPEAVIPTRWASGLAGLTGAGLALGLTEFAAGVVTGIPSLVVAVGQAIIDWSPGTLVHLGIQRLGQHDKGFLIGVILTVCMIVSAALGIAGRRRRWVVRVGFSGFGVVAVVAAAHDRATSVADVVVATALAVAIGLLTVELLLRLATPGAGVAALRPSPSPSSPSPSSPGPSSPGPLNEAAGHVASTGSLVSRRAFLTVTAAAGAIALAAAAGGRRLARQVAVASRRLVRLPPVAEPVPPPTAANSVGVAGVSPVVVPNSEFYRIDTRLLGPPVIDVDKWRLRITGEVDHPQEFTWDQLTALPMVETYMTLQCVSNEVGGALVGNASWRGVPLSDLLQRAGVRSGADQVVGRSVDGFTVGFPTAAVFDGRRSLVAVGMNGDLLPLVHGFPARLVVAGLYGYVSATKWLTEIELTRFSAYNSYWVVRGWDQQAPIKTESRIDTIAPNPPVAGPSVLAGVAWAPTRGISKVEVQVDSEPWGVARLAEALSNDTWRQWSFPWRATPGRHVVRVRATDGRGLTQTAVNAEPLPNAATGYHTVTVDVAA